MQEEEEALSGRTLDGRWPIGATPDMTVGGEEADRACSKDEEGAEALTPFDACEEKKPPSEATPKEEVGSEGTKGVVVLVGCHGPQPPFAYSQENFHIADGNLYSILTPFQTKAAAGTTTKRPAVPGGHQHQQQDTKAGHPLPAAASSPPQQRATRSRRRAKWKLKFHHQALPPEYLDHYEAAMAQEAKAAAAAAATAAPGALAAPTPPPPPPALIRIDKASEGPSKGRPSAKGAARRTPTSIQDTLQQPAGGKTRQLKAEPAEEALYVGEASISSSRHSPLVEEKRTSVIIASGGPSSEGGLSPLRDLPYMGEMTLDSKPRRGRKPKKADICHLIYKNYGTSVPGRCHSAAPSPVPSSPSSSASSLSSSSPSGYKAFAAAGESLLAKRLTQSPSTPKKDLGSEQDEPLNLCIRDLRRINVSGLIPPIVKTEGIDDEGGALLGKSGDRSAAAFSGLAQPVAGNYIYWPNAGVFVHPMAIQSHLLYCHKMAAAPPPADQPPHVACPPPPSIATPDLRQESPFGRSPKLVELAPAIPPVVHPPEEVASAGSSGRKRAVHANSLATKRKRSAIFIPPTAENPTEVSICKFKFTGGAKPSLEEKKMLSVDAGGNFRYYSGTGDKSMRGYEFFPREQTLQQQYMGSNIGSLISGKPPTPSPNLIAHTSFPADDSPPAHEAPQPSGAPSAFQRQGEPLPVGAEGGEGSGRQQLPPPTAPDERKGAGPAAACSGPRRKRRTRKSLVREKLEQTFREKGFLIQTQQLESAEGATYCKFRQLRKFTRYLFRSWKDYLPGNIKEISSSVGGVPSAQESSEAANAPAPNDALPCPPPHK
ncbi:uncharacterized protein [Hetaerina americana]|uniref:uncharacterized protein n=1 Tax=Hetaerina americana TaxID=62018 RepID=UPI003A7F3BCC